MLRSTLATPDLDHPDSDGQPMAETDFQRDVMTYALEALKAHFRKRTDVYVSGGLFIYYKEGNRAAAVAPDVFVVFGVPNHRRRTYLLWQEGKAPDFVDGGDLGECPGGRSGEETGPLRALGDFGILAVRPDGRLSRPAPARLHAIGRAVWRGACPGAGGRRLDRVQSGTGVESPS